MHDALIIAVKAVTAGLLVVAFSLLAEVLQPKSFAGLFGAAPSIALASLVVTVLSQGVSPAREASLAMTVGAVAFVAYCVTAVVAVDRLGALTGSGVAFAGWFIAAGVGYYLFIR